MMKYFILIKEKDQFELIARRDLLNRLIDGIDYNAELHWVNLLSQYIGDDYVQHLMKMLQDYRETNIGTIGILHTTLIHVNDCPMCISDISKKFYTYLCYSLLQLTQKYITEYKNNYQNRTVTFLAAIVDFILIIG